MASFGPPRKPPETGAFSCSVSHGPSGPKTPDRGEKVVSGASARGATSSTSRSAPAERRPDGVHLQAADQGRRTRRPADASDRSPRFGDPATRSHSAVGRFESLRFVMATPTLACIGRPESLRLCPG